MRRRPLRRQLLAKERRTPMRKAQRNKNQSLMKKKKVTVKRAKRVSKPSQLRKPQNQKSEGDSSICLSLRKTTP